MTKIKTLKNIRDHLEPNGKLILNFFYPNLKYLNNKEQKQKRIIKNGKEYILIDRYCIIDGINQIVESANF